jgi:hypothetical protein
LRLTLHEPIQAPYYESQENLRFYLWFIRICCFDPLKSFTGSKQLADEPEVSEVCGINRRILSRQAVGQIFNNAVSALSGFGFRFAELRRMAQARRSGPAEARDSGNLSGAYSAIPCVSEVRVRSPSLVSASYLNYQV